MLFFFQLSGIPKPRFVYAAYRGSMAPTPNAQMLCLLCSKKRGAKKKERKKEEIEIGTSTVLL